MVLFHVAYADKSELMVGHDRFEFSAVLDDVDSKRGFVVQGQITLAAVQPECVLF